MKIFMDSSAIIEFFKGNQNVIDIVRSADEIYTSSICAYEVLIGERYAELKNLHSSYNNALKFFETVATVDLSYSDAINSSNIAAALLLKGKKVDSFDIIIATQARTRGVPVLTTDIKHFQILKEEMGVQIEHIK